MLTLVLAVSTLAVWCTLPDVSSLAGKNPTTTAFIELRRAQAQADGRPFELRWTWRPLARVSPHLRNAVVHSEDPKFWKHDGIDWDAVEQAARADWEAGAMKYGASTITQQVAKNLFLSPSKNPLRKLREWLIARRLEQHLTKDRILELYVNIAEWGDGVFGVEAAARKWFGVSAASLSPAQAARLAVALPNPRKRSPATRSRELDRKAARLVMAMRRDKVIDDATMQAALVELGVARPPGASAGPVPAPASAAPTAAPAAPAAPAPAASDEPAVAPAPR